MVKLPVAIVLVTACGFTPSGEDAPMVDAAATPDAFDTDAACNPLGFTPSNIDACALPPSMGPLAGQPDRITIDTDEGTVEDVEVPFAVVMQEEGPELMLIVADVVGGYDRFSLVGSRPLVLVSLSTIEFSDLVVFVNAGGTDSSFCSSEIDGESQDSGASNRGGSGGGGGGFGTEGGTGARVDGSGLAQTLGGPAIGASLTPLIGGCSGGSGGDGEGLAPGGLGGSPGGALQLVAADSIRVLDSAFIAASGSGGRAPVGANGGGGGGGSGGAILLEAPDVLIDGTLSTNGGGGGEGKRGTAEAADGNSGSFVSSNAAAGGAGNTNGGDGGVGGALGVAAQDGTTGISSGTNGAGGGGGGGSYGRIRIRSNTLSGNGLITPAAQHDPLD